MSPDITPCPFSSVIFKKKMLFYPVGNLWPYFYFFIYILFYRYILQLIFIYGNINSPYKVGILLKLNFFLKKGVFFKPPSSH